MGDGQRRERQLSNLHNYMCFQYGCTSDHNCTDTVIYVVTYHTVPVSAAVLTDHIHTQLTVSLVKGQSRVIWYILHCQEFLKL